MKGRCNICSEETEVKQFVTSKEFMIQLTGIEGVKLYTCDNCTYLVLEAIKQAIKMIRYGVKVSS